MPTPPQPPNEAKRQAKGPPAPSSGFPAPQNYSFGGGPSFRRPSPQSFGPPQAPEAPQSFGQFAKVTEGHVDPNWLSALRDWWNRHSYYPQQAAMLGQDGIVGIEIVVNKYGRVTRLRLESRSGSQWLDLAAQSVFRDANLPPLLAFNSTDQITLDLTIRYILTSP